jgi:hypothetical protein
MPTVPTAVELPSPRDVAGNNDQRWRLVDVVGVRYLGRKSTIYGMFFDEPGRCQP